MKTLLPTDPLHGASGLFLLLSLVLKHNKSRRVEGFGTQLKNERPPALGPYTI